MAPRNSNKRYGLSPAEEEVAQYIRQAQAGTAGADPRTQTRARSGDPQAIRAMGQRFAENARNAEAQQRAAEKAQKDAQAEAERQRKAAEAQAREDQARNVRYAEQGGVQTHVDPETGRKQISRHEDGALKFEPGKLGEPIETRKVKTEIPKGFLGSEGVRETERTFLQRYRDERGRVAAEEIEPQTDPQTGEQFVETTDDFGRPQRNVVGYDQRVVKAQKLERQSALLDLKRNQLAQRQAQFDPVWTPVKTEFEDAKKSYDQFTGTRFEQRGSGLMEEWVRIDSKGKEYSASATEAAGFRERRKQAEERFRAARRKHEELLPTATQIEGLKRQADMEGLKIQAQEIRLRNNLPDSVPDSVIDDAENEGEGQRERRENIASLLRLHPTKEAAATTATDGPEEPEMTEEERARDMQMALVYQRMASDPTIDPWTDPNLVAPGPVTELPSIRAVESFKGSKAWELAQRKTEKQFTDNLFPAGNIKVTLKPATESSRMIYAQDANDPHRGAMVGTIDKEENGAVVMVLADTSMVMESALKANPDVPLYLASNPKAKTTKESAAWVVESLARVMDPALDPAQREQALRETGTDIESLVQKVRSGEIPTRDGNAVAEALYGTSLDLSGNPMDEATMQEWADSKGLEVGKGMGKKERAALNQQFLTDWARENYWKPGFRLDEVAEAYGKDRFAPEGFGAFKEGAGSLLKSLRDDLIVSTAGMFYGVAEQYAAERTEELGGKLEELGERTGSEGLSKAGEKIKGQDWVERGTRDADLSYGSSMIFGHGERAAKRTIERLTDRQHSGKGKALRRKMGAVRRELEGLASGGQFDREKADSLLRSLIPDAVEVYKVAPRENWDVLTREQARVEGMTFEEKMGESYDPTADPALRSAVENYLSTGNPAYWEEFEKLMEMDPAQREHEARKVQRMEGAGDGDIAQAWAGGKIAIPEAKGGEALVDLTTMGAANVAKSGLKLGSKLKKGSKIATGLQRELDKLGSMGLFADTLAKPAGKLKKASNLTVTALKPGLVGAPGEAIQEGFEAFSEPGLSEEQLAENMKQGFVLGALGGPLIGWTMAGVSASVDASVKIQKDREFAAWYNRQFRDVEGFEKITPREAQEARAYLSRATVGENHDKLAELGVKKAQVIEGLREASTPPAPLETKERARLAELADKQNRSADEQQEFEGLRGRMEPEATSGAKVEELIEELHMVETEIGAVRDAIGRDIETAVSLMDEARAAENPADRAFLSGMAKVAAGNAESLTRRERQAVAEATTSDGESYFEENEAAGTVELTDQGRVELMNVSRSLGRLVQTESSRAAFEAQTAEAETEVSQEPAQAPEQEESTVPQARAAEIEVEEPAEAGRPASSGGSVAPARPTVPQAAAEAGSASPAGEASSTPAPTPASPTGDSTPAPTGDPARAVADKVRRRVLEAVPILKDMSLNLVEESQKSGGVVASRDGLTFSLTDIERVIAARNGDVEAAIESLTNTAVREEVIHLVQFATVRKLWQEAGSPGEFGAFMLSWYSDMLAELDSKAVEKAREIYGVEAWDNLETDGHRGAELFRMLVEAKMDGDSSDRFSELFRELTRSGSSKLAEQIRKAIAMLRQLLLEGKLPESATAHIEAIESIYRQLVKGEAGNAQAEAQVEPEQQAEPLAGAGTEGVQVLDLGDGLSRVMWEGQVMWEGPSEQAQGQVNQLEEAATAPLRVTGLAIQEALEGQKLPARVRTQLEGVAEDISEVLEAMPPGERRAFVDQAIADWLSEWEEKKSRKKAPKKQRKLDGNPRQRAFAVLDSGSYPTLSALHRNGLKIAPRPNVVSLVLAKKRKGQKLSEKEMEAVRNVSDWDGAVFQNQFPASGEGRVAREAIKIITGRQKEGLSPDKVAAQLEEGMTSDELWQRLGEELSALSRGELTERAKQDPNQHETPDEQEIAKAEAGITTQERQDKEFQEGNKPDVDASPLAVEDFTPDMVGRTVTIDGEPMEVVAVDWNDFLGEAQSVTLQDGTRFGRQVLEDGEIAYVEDQGSQTTAAEDETPTLEALIPRVAEVLGEESDLARKLLIVQERGQGLPEEIRADLVAVSEAEAQRIQKGIASAGQWQRENPGTLSPRQEQLQLFLDSYAAEDMAQGMDRLAAKFGDQVGLASSPEGADAVPDLFGDIMGPRSRVKENLAKAQAAAKSDKARENVRKKLAELEGVQADKFVGGAQRTLDFGVTGSFASKDQLGLDLAEAGPASEPSKEESGDSIRSVDAAEAPAARGKTFTNPETLSEWREYVKMQGVSNLTEEGMKELLSIRDSYERRRAILERGFSRLTADQLAAYDEVQALARKEREEQAKEREAEVKEKQPKQKQASPGPNKIEDFGEKIGGARKDLWGKFGQAMQAELPDDAASVTLSKHFPVPNVNQLLKAGVSERDIVRVLAMRDEIPAKPRTRWKLKRWVEAVEILRDAAKAIIEGVESEGGIKQLGNIDELLEARTALYQAVGVENISKLGKIRPQIVTYVAGTDFKASPRDPLVAFGIKGESFLGGGMSRNQHEVFLGRESELSTPEKRQAKLEEAAREVAAKLLAEADSEGPKAGNKSARNPYMVYRDRSSHSIFIGRKGANGVVRMRDDIANKEEAFRIVKEEREDLDSEWQAMKEPPILRKAHNIPRQGPRRREGHVTPEAFGETFGFRGVEFGNWVENEKRQGDLNEAYDALLDMSEVLGVPPRALSLDGSLGLAFGARGKGGKLSAAAHYEASFVVINLTKKAGPGSLAHEWWHAVDNYFARIDQTGETAAKELDRWATTGRGDMAKNMRQEVFDKFRALRKAINMSDFKSRSEEADKARSKAYFGTTIEMSARAFEAFVKEELAARKIANDYLVNIDNRSTVYPTTDELQGALGNAYRELVSEWKTRETPKGVMLFSSPEPGRAKADFSPLSKPLERAEQGDFFKDPANRPKKKQGKPDPLGAYRALTKKREKVGLTADEEQTLLEAEQALGQSLAFDMEELRDEARAGDAQGGPESTKKPTRTARQSDELLLSGETERDGQIRLLSSPDRPVTKVKDQTDRDYMAAVEAGDLETAQRMVDEAARFRYPLDVWHGTTETEYVEGRETEGDDESRQRLQEIAEEHGIPQWSNVAPIFERWVEMGMATEQGITVADAAEARLLYEKSKGTSERGREVIGFEVFNFPDDGVELGVHLGNQKQAEGFGPVFHFRADIQNPLRLADMGNWNYQSVMREARKRGVAISEAEYDAVFNAADENQALRDLLIQKGYDGVIYSNEGEGWGDSYIAFKPSQIKSADPVTYDADGKVIPLSQRFNPESGSILYSSPEAETGNPEAASSPERPVTKVKDIPVPVELPKVKARELRRGWKINGEAYNLRNPAPIDLAAAAAVNYAIKNPENPGLAFSNVLHNTGNRNWREVLPWAEAFAEQLEEAGKEFRESEARRMEQEQRRLEEALGLPVDDDLFDELQLSVSPYWTSIRRNIEMEDIVYRGEEEPPNVVNVQSTGLGDSSRVSESEYPLVEITLSNGSRAFEKIRLSGHAQVSSRAPTHYEYDYRQKSVAQAKSKDTLLEDMQEVANAQWDEQREIIEEMRKEAAEDSGPSLQSSPEREAQEEENRKAADAALLALPPIYRDVFDAVSKGKGLQDVSREFGITEKAVENIVNAVRSKIETALKAASPKGLEPAMRDGKLDGGRPDLALGAVPAVAAVDQVREESGTPGIRSWDEVRMQADKMLKADYAGAYQAISAKARDLQQLTDVEVAAAKMIISRETMAGATQTAADRVKLAMLIHGYREIGTETARSLAMRRDPHKTPAERHAQFIAEALFTPDARTRAALKNAEPSQQEDLLRGWLDRVDAIKTDLLAQGVDIDASLAKFRAEQDIRRKIKEATPRNQKIIDEQFKKLSKRNQAVIEAIRDGALVSKAAFITGMKTEEVKKVYSDFLKGLFKAMSATGKRYLEHSLSSALDPLMSRILEDLGLPTLESIDDTAKDFRSPKKERKPGRRGETVGEETGTDTGTDRGTDTDRGTGGGGKQARRRKKPFDGYRMPDHDTLAKMPLADWRTLYETEMRGLRPEDRPSFEEWTKMALTDWRTLYQTEMTGLRPEARPSFEEWRTDKQLKLFPEAINETTGTFDLNDPQAMKAVINAFAIARGTKMDAVVEFWRASILTGPQTHIVNMGSNVLNTAFTLTGKRGLEAAFNNVLGLAGLGSKESATFGEFLPMAKNLNRAAQLAASNAMRSWKLETRTFEAYAKAEALQLDFTGVGSEYIPPALGGKIGKIMRSLSFRAMTAADEFIKSFYAQLEAAAQAHRIARVEKGLRGRKYKQELERLMEPGSVAWVRAIDGAKSVTFQEDLVRLGDRSDTRAITVIDRLADVVKSLRNAPVIGKPITFVVPFIDTPTNIFKQSLEMTPIGGFLAVVDGARSLRRRVLAGSVSKEVAKAEAEKLYNSVRAIRDLTNQTIGLATFFGLKALTRPQDDEEDSRPMITGTVPYQGTKRGERDNAYAVMAPQSIRVGDVVFSYKRIEPFATVLAAVADLHIEADRAGGYGKPEVLSEWIGRFKDGAKDKTFLQGVSTMIDTFEAPERKLEVLTSDIITGFVPNLIRQPIREVDPNIRDKHPRSADGFFSAVAKRVGFGIVPQFAPIRQDLWGNDIEVSRGTPLFGSETADSIWRIFDPLNVDFATDPDPLDEWIFRYNLATADSKDRIGLTPIDSRISVTFPGERSRMVAITPEEQAEINRLAGRSARESLGDDWDKDTPLDEARATRIVDTVRESQRRARALLRKKILREGPEARQ